MKKKTKRSIATILIALALLCGTYLMELLPKEEPKGDFTAQFIDVGQGDSILLTCGTQSAIIDAGTRDSAQNLLKYLENQKIGKPQYVFASHLHADHIGGMADVINKFGCENFIMPESTTNTGTFEKLLDAVKSSGAAAKYGKTGDKFALGEAKIEVLAPPEHFETNNLNNTSLVLKVTFGSHSFLLTGDSEREAEAIYAKNITPITVLKAGHHGSSTSSSDELLSHAQPKFCVISCGNGNSYGHPHKEIIDALNKIGCKILRTDKNGTISFSIKDGEISYETTK